MLRVLKVRSPFSTRKALLPLSLSLLFFFFFFHKQHSVVLRQLLKWKVELIKCSHFILYCQLNMCWVPPNDKLGVKVLWEFSGGERSCGCPLSSQNFPLVSYNAENLNTCPFVIYLWCCCSMDVSSLVVFCVLEYWLRFIINNYKTILVKIKSRSPLFHL